MKGENSYGKIGLKNLESIDTLNLFCVDKSVYSVVCGYQQIYLLSSKHLVIFQYFNLYFFEKGNNKYETTIRGIGYNERGFNKFNLIFS